MNYSEELTKLKAERAEHLTEIARRQVDAADCLVKTVELQVKEAQKELSQLEDEQEMDQNLKEMFVKNAEDKVHLLTRHLDNAQKAAAQRKAELQKLCPPAEDINQRSEPKEPAREPMIEEPIGDTVEKPAEETIKKIIGEPIVKPMDDVVEKAIEKPMEKIMEEESKSVKKPSQHEAVNSFDTLTHFDLDLPAQTVDESRETVHTNGKSNTPENDLNQTATDATKQTVAFETKETANQETAALEITKKGTKETGKKTAAKKRGARNSNTLPQTKKSRNEKLDVDEEPDGSQPMAVDAPVSVEEDMDFDMTQPSTSTAGAPFSAQTEGPRIGCRNTTGKNSKKVFGKKRNASNSVEERRAKIQKKKEEEEKEKVEDEVEAEQFVQKTEGVKEDEDGKVEEYVDEDEEEVEETKEETKERRKDNMARFGRVLRLPEKKAEKINPLEDVKDEILLIKNSKWYAKRTLQDELEKRGDSVKKEDRDAILRSLEEIWPESENAAIPGEKTIALDSTDSHQEMNDKILAILKKVFMKIKNFDDKKKELDKIPMSEKEKLGKEKLPTLLFGSPSHLEEKEMIVGKKIVDFAKCYLTEKPEDKENWVFESEFFKYARQNPDTGYFVSKKNWFYEKKGFKNSGKPPKKTNKSKKAEQEKQKEQAPREQDEQIEKEQEDLVRNVEEDPAHEESGEEEQEKEEQEEKEVDNMDQQPEETKEPSSSVTKSDDKEENLVEVIEVEDGFDHETLKIVATSKDICIIRGLGEALGIDWSIFNLEEMEKIRGMDHQLEILRQMPQHNTKNEKMREKDSPKDNNWEMDNVRRMVTLEQFVKNYEKVQKVVEKGVDDLLEIVRQNGKVVEEDLVKIVKALRDCQFHLKTTKDEGKIQWNFPIISFGTNLDLSETEEKGFKEHYVQLGKLPMFLDSKKGLFKYVEEEIAGITDPQIYFKQPGSRTSAHCENQDLDSVNVNLGPGNCVWLSVSYEYAGFMEELMCNKGVWPYKTVYWPNEKDLEKAGIPYKKFVQKPGDIVYVGTGTFHWVQSEGFTTNVAWNVAQESFKQLASALLVHDHNAEQKHETILPIVPMIWKMAREKAYLGTDMEPLIRSVLVRSLFVSQIEMERAKARGQAIVKVDEAQPPIVFNAVERCESCKNVLFNMIIWEPKGNGKDQRTEQLCMKCATLNKGAVFYYRYDINELVNFFDEYRR